MEKTYRQTFSQTWITLTELGSLFGKTPREIGIYLEEVGLRTFDKERRQHLPTAQAEGFCTPTHSRRKGLLYLWHKQRVGQLLQEKMQLKPLDEDDLCDRALALELLSYCKKFHQDTITFDPLHDILLAPTMPTIIAWYLIEEQKRNELVEPNSHNLLTLINGEYFHMINYELARLGSEMRLSHLDSEYDVAIHLGNVPEFADCDMCRECAEIEALLSS